MESACAQTTLPVPMPEVVKAARTHLAHRYTNGVQALLWEEHQRPLPDVEAIGKVIEAVDAEVHADEGRAAAGTAPEIDAMDLAAALVVLQAARLDMDRLEVGLIDAVRRAGLDWATIASVLDLPDAAAARQRYAALRPRLDAPVDHVDPASRFRPG